MKYRFVVLASLSAVAFFVCPAMRAQDEEGIKQAMSPEEFHKAGLDKLTDEELRNLDRWLKGDREKTAQKAAARTSKRKMDLVGSRGEERVQGMDGNRVVQREDVKAWREAYKFHLLGGWLVVHDTI